MESAEWGEERFQFSFRDAITGIADHYANGDLMAATDLQREGQGDGSLLRVLDGVAEQVQQNLPQYLGVTNQLIGNHGMKAADISQPFLISIVL